MAVIVIETAGRTKAADVRLAADIRRLVDERVRRSGGSFNIWAWPAPKSWLSMSDIQWARELTAAVLGKPRTRIIRRAA